MSIQENPVSEQVPEWMKTEGGVQAHIDELHERSTVRAIIAGACFGLAAEAIVWAVMTGPDIASLGPQVQAISNTVKALITGGGVGIGAIASVSAMGLKNEANALQAMLVGRILGSGKK